MKEYSLKIEHIARKPRSKRYKERGGVSISSTVNTVVTGGGEGQTVGDGHTHSNKEHLDKIKTDGDDYMYLTQGHVGEQGTRTTKVKAGYADMAYDLTEDSPVRDEFLSKVVDDVAKGNISFEQAIKVVGMATFESGAAFGNFVSSLYLGSGAGVDKRGNAEFESVKVRSYFECMELIINRLSAIEGDQILTEGDTIEKVDDLGKGCYGLHLRRKWDGYFTAQAVGNVLKGIVNTLSSGNGKFYTSWMRVNSVNSVNNYIEVVMYADEEVPSGRNFAPCEMMKIARWGNQMDEKRQSCLYLSSTEGRIVRLTGVTKPIIDVGNYGASFGELPDLIRQLTDKDGNPLPLVDGQDYLYSRGIVVQDIIRVDYQGKPKAEVMDRGEWVMGGKYYAGDYNKKTRVYEISDVWHMGCRYRCAKTGTQAMPRWNTTDWAMIEGNPSFKVRFEDTETLFDPDRFTLELKILAEKYNQDVTGDILDADVAWTRYSEDDKGVERVASDNAWAIKRAGSGKVLRLTVEDCDFTGYAPSVLKYIATVTLRDGMEKEIGVATFEY